MTDPSDYPDQSTSSQLGVFSSATATSQKISTKESLSHEVQYDGAEIIISFIAAAIIAAAIYLIPDYFVLEHLFRDIVLTILTDVFFIDAWATPQATINIPDPAISIMGYTPPPYGIVRACTAMQAGAIILALIVVTKAPLRNKIVAGSVFCVMIFVANILRLVFHLYLVAQGVPFWFAHDALSKVIGFIGTIIFALIIEKLGVPLIETFADWMEYAWMLISALLKKIGL